MDKLANLKEDQNLSTEHVQSSSRGDSLAYSDMRSEEPDSRIPCNKDDSIFNDDMLKLVTVQEMPKKAETDAILPENIGGPCNFSLEESLGKTNNHFSDLLGSEASDNEDKNRSDVANLLHDILSSDQTSNSLDLANSTINFKFKSDINGINVLSGDGTVIDKPSDKFVSVNDMTMAAKTNKPVTNDDIAALQSVSEIFVYFSQLFLQLLKSAEPPVKNEDNSDVTHLIECSSDTCESLHCKKLRFVIKHLNTCTDNTCPSCCYVRAQCKDLSAKCQFESINGFNSLRNLDSIFIKFFKTMVKLNDPSSELTPNSSNMVSADNNVVSQTLSYSAKEGIPPSKLDSINRVTYEKQDICDLFYDIVNHMCNTQEACFFLEPVDVVGLNIPDYLEIIREPMDLGTIKKKLANLHYHDPWQVIYDVWLVFDNAFLYNKKNTKVHKYACKLAKMFEDLTLEKMRKLGYCCNLRRVYSVKTLYCNTNDFCIIRPNSYYYRTPNNNILCVGCYDKNKSDYITLNSVDFNGEVLTVPKASFSKQRNNINEPEPFVECSVCRIRQHKVCVMHVDTIDGIFYYCPNCLPLFNAPSIKNKFLSRNLPRTKLSDFIEERVNSYLRSELKDCLHVNIRIICNIDKNIDTKECISNRFGPEYYKRFPYKSKAIFAFQEVNNQEVCFFSLHSQEYDVNCPHPNNRRINISYLDSVHYFQPKHLKTLLYHEIILNYMLYCKQKGYLYCHIWSCPPCEGDDYIFHCHSFEQKLPKPRRLLEWYNTMIETAVTRKIVIGSQDIYKYFEKSKNIELAVNIPYFEGDYWSNSLDDIINEYEKELCNMTSTPVKRTDTARKSSRKVIISPKKREQYTLNQKLLSLMERYKDVFFVLKLNEDNVEFYDEPEPIFPSELMDGRSGFLTICRDNNWEFSSFRHALYSTKATMYVVHQQMFNFTEYACDKCKAVLSTGLHCTTCVGSFDLCHVCYARFGHEHALVEKEYITFELGRSQQDVSNIDFYLKTLNVEQFKKESYKEIFINLAKIFLHSFVCSNPNCLKECMDVKGVIEHFNSCTRPDGIRCKTCENVFAVAYMHSLTCVNPNCPITWCSRLKSHHDKREGNRISKTRSRITNMSEHMNSIVADTLSESDGTNRTEKDFAKNNKNFQPGMERSRSQISNTIRASPNRTLSSQALANQHNSDSSMRSRGRSTGRNSRATQVIEYNPNEAALDRVSSRNSQASVLNCNTSPMTANLPAEAYQNEILRRMSMMQQPDMNANLDMTNMARFPGMTMMANNTPMNSNVMLSPQKANMQQQFQARNPQMFPANMRVFPNQPNMQFGNVLRPTQQQLMNRMVYSLPLRPQAMSQTMQFGIPNAMYTPNMARPANNLNPTMNMSNVMIDPSMLTNPNINSSMVNELFNNNAMTMVNPNSAYMPLSSLNAMILNQNAYSNRLLGAQNANMAGMNVANMPTDNSNQATQNNDMFVMNPMANNPNNMYNAYLMSNNLNRPPNSNVRANNPNFNPNYSNPDNMPPQNPNTYGNG